MVKMNCSGVKGLLGCITVVIAMSVVCRGWGVIPPDPIRGGEGVQECVTQAQDLRQYVLCGR